MQRERERERERERQRRGEERGDREHRPKTTKTDTYSQGVGGRGGRQLGKHGCNNWPIARIKIVNKLKHSARTIPGVLGIGLGLAKPQPGVQSALLRPVLLQDHALLCLIEMLQ